MVKKERILSLWQKILLLAFLCMLIFAQINITLVGNHLQYLIQAPTPQEDTGSSEVTQGLPDLTPDEIPPQKPFQPNGQISSLIAQLKDQSTEWDTLMDAWTVDGTMASASVDSDNGGSTSARVTLLGEKGQLVNPLLIRYGRQFYLDELKNGEKVAILDEGLALEIFKIAEPIDRKVIIGGNEYTVIGIARHKKSVGDLTDFGAYIPLSSAFTSSMKLDTLQVEAVPKKGVGAATSFKTVTSTWQQGGTFIDLGKEGMGAGLWLRVLVFAAGMTAVLRIIRFLNHGVSTSVKKYKAALMSSYAIRLMPRLIAMVLVFILGYAAAAGLAALVLNYIIQPVYTFTEWIPAILVEPKDIAAAFWNVWQQPAVIMELRSPQLLRLRFLNLLVQVGAAGCALLLTLIYARLRGRVQNLAQGLCSMASSGVTLSRIRTQNPIAMAELGYVLMEEKSPAVEASAPQKRGRRIRRLHRTCEMVRVLDAEKILRSLPASRKEGSFVVEITDSIIPRNNLRLLITSDGTEQKITETSREWDLQLTISALTTLLCGSQSFHDFLETSSGFDMRMRSPAMDGIFDRHI